MVIEGYNFHQAFYMTIITISTVGFSELKPLSVVGRYFTSFLIITSFGTFAYAVTAITSYLIDGEFKRYFKELKVKNNIEKLKGHTIICGYGRNGKQSVVELERHGRHYVVVEKDGEVVEQIKSELSGFVLHGDATTDDMLQNAGIERADSIITTLPKDADNVFVVLTAKAMNPDLLIISRASDDHSDRKLRTAGANNVIMPDKIGGAHMASLVIKPDVIEFFDYLMGQASDTISLEEITFDTLPDHFKNKSIKDLDIRNKSGANLVGMKTEKGEYVMNPSPESKIVPEAKIFVLGNPQQIKKFKELLS